MFHIGQLVIVKSVSDGFYLGIILNNLLYLNTFEDAFYQVYLIHTAEDVTVPAEFIMPPPRSEA